MQKRTEQLLKEYPRLNKTATRVANNFYVSKPEPLEMARFSERERREIRNCINCFWLVCLIGLPNSSLYSYGGQNFHHLGGRRGRQALLIRLGPHLIYLPMFLLSCPHTNTTLSINSHMNIHDSLVLTIYNWGCFALWTR